MGMFLRRGPAPSKMRTVSIIGKYFGSCYVIVGDTKYRTATEVTAEIGTTVVAHVSATDSTGLAGCKIYLDGVLVGKGNADYTLVLQDNITIKFVRPDSSTSAVECYIVTQ